MKLCNSSAVEGKKPIEDSVAGGLAPDDGEDYDDDDGGDDDADSGAGELEFEVVVDVTLS